MGNFQSAVPGSKRYLKAGSGSHTESNVCKNGGTVKIGQEDGFNVYDPSPPSKYKWKFISEENNQYYRIRLDNYCSGRGWYYLSTSNFSCDKGTNIIFKPWDSSSNNNKKQKWEVESVENGYHKLRLQGCGDKYLTIDSGNNSEDNKLILWTETGDHQEWSFRPTGTDCETGFENSCYVSKEPYYAHVNNDICRKKDQGCSTASNNSRCCTGQ